MPKTKSNPDPVLYPLPLSVAGFRFRLWLPLALYRSARHRYRAFLLKAVGKTDLSIRIRQLPSPSSHKRVLSPVSMTWSKAGAEIHRDDFTFQWPGRGKDATLECRGGIFTLDSLLRVFLSQHLVEQGGFLLHAAGLAHPRCGAFALPGVSGSGKSTAARLCAGLFTVLNDELVAVTQGPKGRWQVHGTPFWGGFKGRGINRRARLSALLFLHKGAGIKLERIPEEAAVAGLLKCVLYFNRSPERVARLFGSVGRCVARVPAFRMTFRRSRALAQELLSVYFEDSNRSLTSGS